MSDAHPSRRRIDRVTDPDLLDGLADRPTGEVRALRDDCRAEEARLSYARRLLHGQLDVARAELQRRADGGSDVHDLVESLGRVLSADHPAPARSAVNAEVYVPADEHGRRDEDDILDGLPLATLPDLDDDALTAAVASLQLREQEVSARRRTVLDHLDRLQGELVARYRDGAASVDDVSRGTAG